MQERKVANHANIERNSMNTIKVMENVQRLDGEDVTNNPSTSAQHPVAYPINYNMLLESWDEDIV